MRKSQLVAVAAIVGLAATGCGSSKSSTSATTAAATASTAAAATTAAASASTAAATTAAAPASTAAAATTAAPAKVTDAKDITIAVITHGDGGGFWSVAQKGAEAAGKDLGIKVKYQGANNKADDQAKMVDQAVTDKVQGIAISLADPKALTESAKKVVAAGIPLVTLNSGIQQYKELGAITHVGQSELDAGRGAGERLKAAGGKVMLCVMQEQSNVGLAERCKGAAETFGGKVVELTTSGDAKPDASQGEIKTKLDADATIDSVFATGPVGALLAQKAVAELKKKITIGAVDLSPPLLDAIEKGDIAFTIDQQQYIQGYLSVVILYLNITNKNTVGGGQPVATGPGFVDKTNVAAVKDLVAKGTR